MKKKGIFAYFGHHKCAMVWVRKILSKVCKQLTLKFAHVDSPLQFNNNLAEFVKSNRVDFLVYINANINFTFQLKNIRGFHVIRDPRDIAVSSYFSHLFSHPTNIWEALKEHREKLRVLPKSEGLLLDIEFIHKGVFECLQDWDYSLPHILELKMEDLIHGPIQKFSEILNFLGLLEMDSSKSSSKRISLKKLSKILKKNSFLKLSGGRNPGVENVHNHFRKGEPGDWKNHFTNKHKIFFKKRYGDLLIKLGYEKDNNW